MTNVQSTFLKTVSERGFVHQCTDSAALDALLAQCESAKKPLVAYIGFDCTAPSLHVGSLIQIMMLYWLQKSGHKPIVLMGGGTTKVGDPSGKDESRQLLSDEKIQENMEGIKQVFSKFLGNFETTFDASSTAPFMVNNDEWLSGLKYIEFLRDYGRLISVNQMLARDSVKVRLERQQHLTFLEFNYMVLQAYDYVELRRRYECRLQMGGSDQWGNILSGTNLYSFAEFDAKVGDSTYPRARTHLSSEDKRLFGLTTPLLTTSAGAKMGKTADGAVWLNPDMFSAYDYWQFWRNTEDADVGRFLRLFTTLDMTEISRLESLPGAGINDAKKALADAATNMLHGKDAAANARKTAEETFEQGGTSDNLPTEIIAHADAAAPLPAYKLFLLAKLADSGKEARRLIQSGGAKVNDEKVENENDTFDLIKLTAEKPLKLSAGKKKHILVKIG